MNPLDCSDSAFVRASQRMADMPGTRSSNTAYFRQERTRSLYVRAQAVSNDLCTLMID